MTAALGLVIERKKKVEHLFSQEATCSSRGLNISVFCHNHHSKLKDLSYHLHKYVNDKSGETPSRQELREKAKRAINNKKYGGKWQHILSLEAWSTSENATGRYLDSNFLLRWFSNMEIKHQEQFE